MEYIFKTSLYGEEFTKFSSYKKRLSIFYWGHHDPILEPLKETKILSRP